MPTLDYVDGYETRIHDATADDRLGGTSQTGIYTNVVGVGGTDVAGYESGRAVRMTLASGVANRVSRELPASSGRRVVSFYVKVTGVGAAERGVFDIGHGASGMSLRLTSAGVIKAYNGATNNQTGPDIDDGEWHRIDLDFNTTANPWVLKWQVDGVAQTDVTQALAADTAAVWSLGLGDSLTTAAAITIDFDHTIAGTDGAGYPYGAHRVKGLFPNGDGTHSISGAGDFDRHDGTDILSSTTTAWQEVDDWITGAADVTTGIKERTISATEYVEITFDDNTDSTIWAVWASYAHLPGSTTAHNCQARVVDSGGTLLTTVFSGDPSVAPTATLHFRTALVAAPGGTWDDTEVDGLKFRWGFSSDVTPNPEFSAVMLQIAVPATDVVNTDLVIADAAHTQAADNLVLVQHYVLSTADALHSHTADNLALTQNIDLVVAEALHGHLADSLVLVQNIDLSIQDALHGHAADNLVLSTEGGASLVIADAAHSHLADGLLLLQHHVLGVADAAHGHAAESLTLVYHYILVVAEALHAHTADGQLVLAGNRTLAILDALHAHMAGNIGSLGGPDQLDIDDALHALLSDELGSIFGTNLHVETVERPFLTVDRWR